jgi:hypothetical protein
MTSRDRDVIEADFAVGVPAELRDGLVEGETSASLGPGANNQDANLERQVADWDDDVIVRARCVLEGINRREGDCAVVQGVQWFATA